MQILIPVQPLNDGSYEGSASLAKLQLGAIDRQPWMQYVIDRLPRQYARQSTFVMPDACRRLYCFDELVYQLLPEASVVVTPDGIKGGLCMAMYACPESDGELFIISGNQALNTNWDSLFEELRGSASDAAVVTMESSHPRWPHVRIDEAGYVVEASETRLLSRHAIAGVYYFRSLQSFFDCATAVIRKGGAVDGMFGIPGTLNELILRSKAVRAVSVDASLFTALHTDLDCAAVA